MIVGYVQVGEMTIHHEAELFVVAPGVVAEEQGMGKVFVILPDVRQQHFESTAAIPLDGGVLHYPVEEIVRVPRVTTELMYRFTVVRDQTVIYVDRDFGQIGLEYVPMRCIHVYGLLAIVRYLASDQLYSFVRFSEKVVSNFVQVTIVVERK